MARTAIVKARFAAEDLTALDAAAEAEGLDRSKLIRRAWRAYSGEPYFTDADMAALEAGCRELNMIGRNLMQAVHHMNRLAKGGEPFIDPRDHYSAQELRALQVSVANYARALKDAARRRGAKEKRP